MNYIQLIQDLNKLLNYCNKNIILILCNKDLELNINKKLKLINIILNNNINKNYKNHIESLKNNNFINSNVTEGIHDNKVHLSDSNDIKDLCLKFKQLNINNSIEYKNGIKDIKYLNNYINKIIIKIKYYYVYKNDNFKNNINIIKKNVNDLIKYINNY